MKKIVLIEDVVGIMNSIYFTFKVIYQQSNKETHAL